LAYTTLDKLSVVFFIFNLGYIICKNSDDNLDILNQRSSFIAQANDVICTFGKLDENETV